MSSNATRPHTKSNATKMGTPKQRATEKPGTR